MSGRAKKRHVQGCTAHLPLFGLAKSRLAENAKEAKAKTQKKEVAK